MYVAATILTLLALISQAQAAAGTPEPAFVAPPASGHWEFLNASWNDFDGDYTPMKLHRSPDGKDVRWVVEPAWHLKITPDGVMHADNGNDAVLAFRAERDIVLKVSADYVNAGSPVFFGIRHGTKHIAGGGQIGKSAKGQLRGIVDLQKGDSLFFRVALKHLHAGASRQDFRVTPKLIEIAALPNLDKLPPAPGWPTVGGKPVFPIGFLHYQTSHPFIADLTKLGFNATQIDLAWSHVAPGRDQFDSEFVKNYLDGAQKNGMMLSLLLSWHMRPHWLPDEWLFKDIQGKTTQANFLHCSIWHPEVRQHQAKVIEAICSVSARHPATLGYVLANEPDMRDFSVGYGEHAIKAFRKWLQDHYDDIDALNQRWQVKLTAFDDVEPPRPDLPKLDNVNRAAWLDWITFRNESFAEYWQFLADEIRKHHPDALISHKMMWKGMASDIAAKTQQNYRLWSKAVNVTGGDVYPHPYENFTQRWLTDAFWSFGDGHRSWLNEHNSAFQEQRPDYPLIPPGSYSAWLWQGIGRGVAGAFHWMMVPDLEAGTGGSYAFSDGTLAPSFWNTAQAVWRIRRIEPYLVRVAPAAAQVAVLHSWPTLIQQPGAEPGGYATSVVNSLYRRHLRVRFIDEHYLRTDRLQGVKAILLPGAFCLSDEDWKALDGFAAAGGLVVAWPKTGDFDELNQPNRLAVEQRFGLKIKGYRVVEMKDNGPTQEQLHLSWTFQKKPAERKLVRKQLQRTPSQITNGDHLLKPMVGTTLQAGMAGGFEDFAGKTAEETVANIELNGAKAMATFDDGAPAITQHGRFVYIAASPMNTGPASDDAVRQLLVAGGVEPIGYVRDAEGHAVDHVDFAAMQGDGFRLVIVTNQALSRDYDGRPAPDLRIGIRGPDTTRVVRLLDIPKELSPVTNGDYIELQASFMPGEAKVYLVAP